MTNKLNEMKKVNTLFGTMSWYGKYDEMPAIIGNYYGGSTLYVLKDDSWYECIKGESEAEILNSFKVDMKTVIIKTMEENRDSICIEINSDEIVQFAEVISIALEQYVKK